MTRESPSPITKRRRAFTLMEGLTASIILAILALGVLGSLSAAFQQSQFVHSSATATLLGRQLADEITSRPFDPSNALGPGGLTSRSLYTNVSNYNGYSDSSTSMPLLEGGSLDVTGSDVYNRQASVTAGCKVTMSPPGQPPVDIVSSDFAIATVTVTTPDGQSFAIPEFVAKYPLQRQ